MDREALEALGRRDLQALAKKHGVKANAKSAVIVESLLEVLASDASESQDAPLSPSNKEGESRGDDVAQGDDDPMQDDDKEDEEEGKEEVEGEDESGEGVDDNGEKGVRATPSEDAVSSNGAAFSPVPALDHPTLRRARIPAKTRRAPTQAPKASAASPVAQGPKSAAKTRTAPKSAAKTRTAPKASASTRRGAHKRGAPPETATTAASSALASSSSAAASPKRRRLAKEKENSRAPLSQAKPRVPQQRKPAATNVAQRGKTPGRFDRAHAQLFNTQKSIVDTHAVKAQSALKPKRPTTASRYPKSAVKPGRAPLAASKSAAGAVNTPTHARGLKSVAKAKTARKPAFRVDVSAAAAAASSNEAPVSSTTSASSAAAKKRPKFDLQESLKRPITWKMKTGPLR